jgi:CBS domain containing-hemolysin-like protein
MSIGSICERRVPAVPATISVLEAARSMHSFGDRMAIVIDERAGRRIAVGVVTEHELVGVLVHREDPATLTVSDIMRPHPAFVGENDDVLDTLYWMRRNGLHEAVVHGRAGAVVGTVSLDRLADSVAGELCDVTVLEPAQPGVPARGAH